MSLAEEYVPLLIVFAAAGALAVAFIILTSLLGPKRPTASKRDTFECGSPPVGSPRRRLGNRFYIVALLFVVFDIEVAFLYPWAVSYRSLGLTGIVEMFVFIGMLTAGLAYVWKSGCLDWD